jgi:threonine/homoserine/homoserine lactone efflux protein
VPLLSDGPIVALAVFALSQIPEWFQRVLFLAGGIFVLYLARSAWLSWKRPEEAMAEQPVHYKGIFQAATINLLSPGPYLYWGLVTGPILAAGWRESPPYGIGFICGFYGAMVCAQAVLIVLFGTAGRLGPKVNHALVGVSAILLTIFGIWQIWRGAMGM